MSKTFWIILGIVVAGLIGIFVLFGDNNTPKPATSEQPLELTDQEHTKGSRDAKATLVEYADFQCPSCKAVSPMVNQLIEEYDNRVLVVVRHFPLTNIHPNAFAAARAAEAAGTQNKFFEMGNILFERQSEWEADTNAKAKFEAYAQELGLNMEQFRDNYESSATRDRINRDIQSGKDAGATGTPSFFLNGEKMQIPADYNELKSSIDAKLKQ